MSNLVLTLYTDGRFECLNQTIKSWERNLESAIMESILIDDSGDAAYSAVLVKHFDKKFDRVIRHQSRMGYLASITETWLYNLPPNAGYVLHLEDDFVLDRPFNAALIVELLRNYHHLAQMSLMRAPWAEEEVAVVSATDVPRKDEAGFVRMSRPVGGAQVYWIEQNSVFTTAPCIYPIWVTKALTLQSDVAPNSGIDVEEYITRRVRETYPSSMFGIFGWPEDGSMIRHISIERLWHNRQR